MAPTRSGTPNPLLPEVPPPVRNISIEEALKELKKEMDFFFSIFKENNQQQTLNPFFGQCRQRWLVVFLETFAGIGFH